MDFTAKQIAELTGGKLEGNPEAVVNTFCKKKVFPDQHPETQRQTDIQSS